MKTQRRHELHTNVLADWLGRKMEAIQPYIGWVAAGALAIVLAYLGYSYFNSRSEAQMLEGWGAATKYGGEATSAVGANDTPGFQDATKNLAKLVDEYSGTPLATFAEANLGDVNLYRGQMLMWTNRSEALQSLKEAVASYNSAIGSTKEPLLKNRLRMNLATAYEWMFQVEDAKRAYQQVEGIYKPAAEQQIAALERATTDQLFERLQKFQPAPPPIKAKPPEAEFGKEGEDLFKQIPGLKDLEKSDGGTDSGLPIVQPTGADTKAAIQDSKPTDATK
ncbi:MAG: tetratricopeptide repeat protein [Planctomycetes bacterium]|nr:tetratricopeptide repeat protein [Planctomycetota bacterium]